MVSCNYFSTLIILSIFLSTKNILHASSIPSAHYSFNRIAALFSSSAMRLAYSTSNGECTFISSNIFIAASFLTVLLDLEATVRGYIND